MVVVLVMVLKVGVSYLSFYTKQRIEYSFILINQTMPLNAKPYMQSVNVYKFELIWSLQSKDCFHYVSKPFLLPIFSIFVTLEDVSQSVVIILKYIYMYIQIWRLTFIWLMCLPLIPDIMSSTFTRVTTMFLHMTPVLVGSRKRTRKWLI
jgi:hypothetical protein